MTDDDIARSGQEPDDTIRRRFYTHVNIVRGHSEARALCESDPDAVVIVDRQGPRNLVFSCPCKCGEILSINIDPAAGSAWRMLNDFSGVSLMPSVWRTTGCRSHFILWRSRVWWCMYDDVDEDDWPFEIDADLRREWFAVRSEMRRRRE
jgi:hypothetical protein